MMNPISLLVCLPTALAVRSTRTFSLDLLAPLLGYVCIYSLLPHKEWRFITNIIPGTTAVAAAGASWIWTRKSKTWMYSLFSVVLVLSVAVSTAASLALLAISSLNYPGAYALNKLHELADSTKPEIHVRLDNLSRQTGATRFLQKDGVDAMLSNTTTRWYYDKTINPYALDYSDFWSRFDYVLEEYPEKVPGDWEVLEVIEAYAGLSLTKGVSILQMYTGPHDKMSTPDSSLLLTLLHCESWLKLHVTGGRWPRIRMEPMISILMRQSDSKPSASI